MNSTTVRFVCVITMSFSSALAQDFSIGWYGVDGGGGMFATDAGDLYVLGGTIGQPDAGSFAAPLTGGPYELVGGFWGVGFVLPCPADLDGDRQVALSDLTLLLGAFGACAGNPNYNASADISLDGCIDLLDLSILLANFGIHCP